MDLPYDKWEAARVAYRSFMLAVQDATGFQFDPESLRNTPRRVAGIAEELICGKDTANRLIDAAMVTFPSESKEMTIITGIKAIALCPHHMLPVQLVVDVGYIPDKQVIGASKFSRIVRAIARRPVIQEDLCHDIANTIQEKLQCKGVGVHIRGEHSCMRVRGVKDDAIMVSCAVRGIFLTEPHAKDEWLRLIGR